MENKMKENTTGSNVLIKISSGIKFRLQNTVYPKDCV